MAITKKGYLGQNNPNWKGGNNKCLKCGKLLASRVAKVCFLHRRHRSKGKPLNNMGYVRVYEPKHPYSGKDGYIFEHRLVLEKKIGRYLLPEEKTHHINHKRDDNRPENLIILEGGEHTRLHHLGKSLSNEHRLKISDRMKGNQIWKGKKHMLETKRKMSEARKKYWERKNL